jgi:glucose-6-phosphate isomerase
MVVLPYKDRLALFPRYLQQLVMESLGKRHDRAGLIVNQGISVFGNKGSTDQHSYVQQLRDGPDNFFVTFIAVLRDRAGTSVAVEPGVTSGDYLTGFLWGTREALTERGRASLTITLRVLDAFSLGMLVALYERAVGLYAFLVNVNAYHQPGVEAGKIAAREAIIMQGKLFSYLRSYPEEQYTAEELAEALGVPEKAELIFYLLEHAAANDDHGIVQIAGQPSFRSRFGVKSGV